MRLPPDALTLDMTEAGQRVRVLRITEEGERDPRLLDYLQKSRLVPGAVVTVNEVAPWSGVFTLNRDDATIPIGLKAARTIWVQPAAL